MYKWVTSHTSMCHVMYMNESCHIHQCVMSYTLMSHLTYMNVSCHTYECVILRTSMRSWHTYEWVMPHTSMRHFMYTNEFCHIHECIMSYHRMSHATYILEFQFSSSFFCTLNIKHSNQKVGGWLWQGEPIIHLKTSGCPVTVHHLLACMFKCIPIIHLSLRNISRDDSFGNVTSLINACMFLGVYR